MGKIVTVASQKGGVGKTTTALNLGYALSRLGGEVLLVDADPQGSLATSCQLKQREFGLLQVLRGESQLTDVTQYTKDRSMAVIGTGAASASDYLDLEQLMSTGACAPQLRTMAQRFRYVLIDAPSGVGKMVLGLLAASDGVISPVQPKALTLKTLPAFVKTIHHVRKSTNSRLRLDGIVLSMVQAGNRAEERVIEELRELLPEDVFFQTTIPNDDAFEEATLRGVPVMLLPGARELSRVYIDLALELRERDQLIEENDGETSGLF